MMTRDEINSILAEIKLRGPLLASWGFRCHLPASKNGEVPPDGWLQVINHLGECNRQGIAQPWHGRKWRLSPHMTSSEIVQTALKAVLTALEHEARECFTYKGETVFDPHLDVDALVEFRKMVRLDKREEHSLNHPMMERPDLEHARLKRISAALGTTI